MEAEQKCFEHMVAWEIVSTEQIADRIIYPTGHECFVFHAAAKVRCKCCGRIELIKNDILFFFPPAEKNDPRIQKLSTDSRTGISIIRVIRGFFKKIFHV